MGIREYVVNIVSRSELLKSLLDKKHTVDDDCGYAKTSELTAQDFREWFDREAVAERVVTVFPEETWVVTPTVYETEDENQTTEFESAWAELNSKLSTSKGQRDEESAPIWEYLERVDVLCGIGRFGVLLLGINDGKPLSEPVEPSESNELLYVRCYDESLVSVSRVETDQTNPRYGHPVSYNVQSETGSTRTSLGVHWSRIIHVADNLVSSEVYGRSRMLPVWNRLYDLRKLYAGSAEMYWRGAFPGVLFELHPSLVGMREIDDEKLKEWRDEIENFTFSLQRSAFLEGVTAKPLSPQVVDPSPQIEKQIEAICIELGIPKRIFMGSERGELASGQDARTWNKRIARRQNRFVTPKIIAPFIDRLIDLRVLPEPKEGYKVVWPDLNALTPEEQAAIAERRTKALATYVGGGVNAVIDPLDFLVKVLDFGRDEALEMLSNAVDSQLMQGEGDASPEMLDQG